MSRAAQRRLAPLMRAHGEPIAFPTPYYGGGNATALAVIGDGCRDVYTELGVSTEKIRVTGYPLYEDMVRAADESRASLHTPNCELRAALGLPTVGPVVLWCTNDQTTYWEHDHDEKTMRRAWRDVRDAVLGCIPSAHLVIKPHPKESPVPYDELVRGEPRATVAANAELVPLIEDAAAVITRFSSTGVTALCRGVPVITVNFPKVPGGTLFEDTGGTLHCNTPEELRASLTRLTLDPGVWDDVADRRHAFLRRFVSIDPGRSASDRLVDLMEELAGTHPTMKRERLSEVAA